MRGGIKRGDAGEPHRGLHWPSRRWGEACGEGPTDDISFALTGSDDLINIFRQHPSCKVEEA
jgi:hypothetical protein